MSGEECISIRNVSVRFDGHEALRNLNLQIFAGEFVLSLIHI